MSDCTPGPWYVDGTVAAGPYNILTGSDQIPQDRCIVASFDIHRRLKKEDRPRLVADANLIAAAPDLLAALKALRELVGDAFDCRGAAELEMADMAIAMAEGR